MRSEERGGRSPKNSCDYPVIHKDFTRKELTSDFTAEWSTLYSLLSTLYSLLSNFTTMTIKQLSIFIENKSGTLIRVLDLLSRANIQIIASTIADTQDYGIYRVLCSAPGQAFLILKDNGINVQLADVMAITIDDEPGRAALAVKALSDAGVNILYMYSFLWKGKGVLTMRTDEVALAEKVIQENAIQLLNETEFNL